MRLAMPASTRMIEGLRHSRTLTQVVGHLRIDVGVPSALEVVALSQAGLMPGGEEESNARARYPLRCAIRTLHKVVGADLQAQTLRPEAERLADVRAHRNEPCVGGVG